MVEKYNSIDQAGSDKHITNGGFIIRMDLWYKWYKNINGRLTF